MRFKDEPQNDDDLHRAVARNAAELYGSRNDSSRFIAFYRRSFLTGSRLGARLRFKKCSTEFLFRFFTVFHGGVPDGEREALCPSFGGVPVGRVPVIRALFFCFKFNLISFCAERWAFRDRPRSRPDRRSTATRVKVRYCAIFKWPASAHRTLPPFLPLPPPYPLPHPLQHLVRRCFIRW